MRIEEMIVVVAASATQELCNKGIIKKQMEETIFVGITVGLLTGLVFNHTNIKAKDDLNILDKLILETSQFRESKKHCAEIATGFFPSILGMLLAREILSNEQLLRFANLPESVPNQLDSFYKKQLYFAVLSVAAKY